MLIFDTNYYEVKEYTYIFGVLFTDGQRMKEAWKNETKVDIHCKEDKKESQIYTAVGWWRIMLFIVCYFLKKKKEENRTKKRKSISWIRLFLLYLEEDLNKGEIQWFVKNILPVNII